MTNERLRPAIALTPDLLPLVETFDCGSQPWAQEVPTSMRIAYTATMGGGNMRDGRGG